MTATSADSTFELKENNVAQDDKVTLIQTLSDPTTHMRLMDHPLVFPNGVFVGTVTAGGKLTLQYIRT